jgi:sorting and assembly machinery component 37
VSTQLHSFYCMSPNYKGLTLPTIVSFMHPPRSYYVPSRLKEMAKPRLEAAGLWDLMSDDPDTIAKTISWSRDVVGSKDSVKDDADKIRDTLDREKVDSTRLYRLTLLMRLRQVLERYHTA